ncbi:MAG: gamma carbonic anhydrase family protein [Clostridiales bacterium]|nr:gamma carbonic anhydrase family protein [Clostridiales bacterium]
MIYSFKGKYPNLKNAAFVADNAVIAGETEIGEGSSVWFSAVIRADDEKIIIGKNSNIQDNCTVHCSPGYPVKIGDNVTVGHNALVHGCTVGSGCLIGMHATVMNGAVLGKNCLVGAGALVTENKKFPDNSLIMGVPAKAVAVLDEDAVKKMMQNAEHYRVKAQEYKNEKLKSVPVEKNI